MTRRPPRSTRPYTLFPYATLFRSLLACAGLALLAWGFEAPFAYDPVGPRAYPLLLLLLMACGAAWLLFKPHGEPTPAFDRPKAQRAVLCVLETGRASCTERVCQFV